MRRLYNYQYRLFNNIILILISFKDLVVLMNVFLHFTDHYKFICSKASMALGIIFILV